VALVATTSRMTRDVAAAAKDWPVCPLYNDRVRFSGQSVALVVAEEPEIVRFAGFARACRVG
jgi:CO/xanthine dehydrogenase Mo-binding subunit